MHLLYVRRLRSNMVCKKKMTISSNHVIRHLSSVRYLVYRLITEHTYISTKSHIATHFDNHHIYIYI